MCCSEDMTETNFGAFQLAGCGSNVRVGGMSSQQHHSPHPLAAVNPLGHPRTVNTHVAVLLIAARFHAYICP